MSAGWTLACSSKPTVSTRICRLIPLIFLPARIIAGWINADPPFSALFTLWLSITQRCRAGLPTDCLAALHIQRIVDLLDCPIVVPPGQVVV